MSQVLHKTLTVLDTETTSQAVELSNVFDFIPTIIYCPPAVTGTKARIHVENPATGTYQPLSALGGLDDSFFIANDGTVALEVAVRTALRNKKIKIVTETTQGQDTDFVVEYQEVKL